MWRRAAALHCPGVDDPDLDGTTVADVLADPAAFEGETLADPLEGIEYGRCKAQIMRRADGTPWIHSFAHGHTTYELKLDAAAVRAAMAAADASDVVQTFGRLALQPISARPRRRALSVSPRNGVAAASSASSGR